MERRTFCGVVLLAPLLALGTVLESHAQAGAIPGTAAGSARAAAPIDLTGYWVSIVTQDWRWRMVTPARGDFQSVPITDEAYRMALKWDPARDEAAGEQCKSYGAAAIMQVPERLHIDWQDDGTLRVETDAGIQTRVFHFGEWQSAAGTSASWQGDSQALWQSSSGPGEAAAAPTGTKRSFGTLKVVTSNLRPGYLRKNGLPYSARTVVTEYWDLVRHQNGDQWIVITSLVRDPVYLQNDWITSLLFKKEPDGKKWDPQPCSARW
jgi:hypothetical protein